MMDSHSILSPASQERRRAWLRSSRYKAIKDDDCSVKETVESHLPQLDDVFEEGQTATKIESWLEDCGSSEESISMDSSLSLNDSGPKPGISFEDDLTLGAEATMLPRCHKVITSCRQKFERFCPQRFLNLNASMASSTASFKTFKTISSIKEFLEIYREDPEITLYDLGFGREEPKITAKIPARFFNFPSQANGINFRLFLESQIERIYSEDPSLTLASRFLQIETLTASANALYSLYSHVSKTPIQKIGPVAEFSYSMDIPGIKLMSPRQEPKSPVDRLKEMVSKMCLYGGSKDTELKKNIRQSPRKDSKRLENLGDIVEEGPGCLSPDNMHSKSATMQGHVNLEDFRIRSNFNHKANVTVGSIEKSGSINTNLSCEETSIQSPHTGLTSLTLSQPAQVSTDSSFAICEKNYNRKCLFSSESYQETTDDESDSDLEVDTDSSNGNVLMMSNHKEFVKSISISSDRDLQQNFASNLLQKELDKNKERNPKVCRGPSLSLSIISHVIKNKPSFDNSIGKDVPCMTDFNPSTIRYTNRHKDFMSKSWKHQICDEAVGFDITTYPMSRLNQHRSNIRDSFRDHCGHANDFQSEIYNRILKVGELGNKTKDNSCSGLYYTRTLSLPETTSLKYAILKSPSFKQENSFDMEEVQSISEGQSSFLDYSNVNITDISSISVRKGRKDLILRDDSTQSDSSGFMEDMGS
ncbi:protein TESPA1 [Protopterus annectens]|uniref:protein TESPA1 n=1 Tax=Protopterus annectens TaxID=7888 RepID=UPI001CFAA456|nr:protein TESPA1 [Protopterus annectens]XP_043939799.1 protein TESPA1 [Protopterus annectens]